MKKRGKQKKKVEPPPTRRYDVYCEGCNSVSEHFMTGVEFYNKTVMEQWCKVCDRMTKWAIHFKESEKAGDKVHVTPTVDTIFEPASNGSEKGEKK